MAVFGLVSAVAGFVKVRYLVDKAVIDNMVFRAHYRITSAILFACCILVCANNLIGKQSRSVCSFFHGKKIQKNISTILQNAYSYIYIYQKNFYYYIIFVKKFI